MFFRGFCYTEKRFSGGGIMTRENNYLLQAKQARQRFLTYDPQKLMEKGKLRRDAEWLYATMLSCPYRISTITGDVQRLEKGDWVDANTFSEVMTLLDLVCDSREERFLTLRWKNMRDFGLQFHSGLLEAAADPWARRFQDDAEGFCRACEALGGQRLAMGDIAYAIELFDGLCIVLQLWFGDEEFPPNLRYLWDENAGMYLRYETMYYARDLLLEAIARRM